ncbi:hypothetical protein C3L33_13995, partial [Rhododendron williamsianum]
MHKLNHMSSLLLYLSFFFYLLFSSSSSSQEKMHKLNHMSSLLLYLSFFFYLLFSSSSSSLNVAASEAGTNPFTPKASLIRYWKIQISNDLPKPWFLLNKASPLTAVESATFSKLANDQNALTNQLQSFCSSADLLCFPDLLQNLEKNGDINDNKNYAGAEVNPKWVEPGMFFRERMLKMGTIMPMPDIKDKMPKRSFLPRVISSKLPFSKISEMKRIFHAGENSSMASMLATAVSMCERASNAGETKRCVGSAEDMIDFSISVLGHNVVVRTTENMEGSNKDVMIGKVSKINGGKVTTSVSCHQSLFPYLLYYCHSVLKVRVYEADILDPKTMAKINHGVAICHVDTSSWSAGHVAFMALGSGPGKIEVNSGHPFSEKDEENLSRRGELEHGSMLAAAVSECERGRHRRDQAVVGSMEDMIDFAISMLGRNVVVRTTKNNKGSKKDIMIGKVSGINVGRVTKSVSCHQSLFPYLLYYCHSVPKVWVYEADILYWTRNKGQDQPRSGHLSCGYVIVESRS